MEHIRQALEQARKTPAERRSDDPLPSFSERPLAAVHGPAVQTPSSVSAFPESRNETHEVRDVPLNASHLEAHRIISHSRSDPRAKSFDILRTQVLQAMDAKSWRLIGVTSPSAQCGKSAVAVNLALSIARYPDRSVVLVDLDMQKPQIANLLGLKPQDGVLSLIEHGTLLEDALVSTHIGKYRLSVLPCERSTQNSSERVASRVLGDALHFLSSEHPSRIVIVDLPPLLIGDDVISILPQLDCALLVGAVGTTTTSEIRECRKHLEQTPVVRMVLNKVTEAGPVYGD